MIDPAVLVERAWSNRPCRAKRRLSEMPCCGPYWRRWTPTLAATPCAAPSALNSYRRASYQGRVPIRFVSPIFRFAPKATEVVLCAAIDVMCQARTLVGSGYVSFAFQKIGAPNLRTPWTFLRKAVGWTHSPHGTYVTSLRATF